MNNQSDDDRDNVEKIKESIKSTKHNMELAKEIIVTTSDKKKKRDLQLKNEGREEAIPSLIRQMKEEEAKKELGEE